MTSENSSGLVKHRLAVLRHAEEVTGNVAMTCRYYGISRQTLLHVDAPLEESVPRGSRPVTTARAARTPPMSRWSARSSTSARTTTSARPRSRCTCSATTT